MTVPVPPSVLNEMAANAHRLLDDARVLAGAKRWAGATASATLAIEAAAKWYLCAYPTYTPPKPPDKVETGRNRVTEHMEKGAVGAQSLGIVTASTTAQQTTREEAVFAPAVPLDTLAHPLDRAPDRLLIYELVNSNDPYLAQAVAEELRDAAGGLTAEWVHDQDLVRQRAMYVDTTPTKLTFARAPERPSGFTEADAARWIAAAARIIGKLGVP